MFTGERSLKRQFCFRNYALHFGFYCCSANGIAIPFCKNFKVMARVVEKINQITRWLTIVITLVQGPTYIYNLYRTLPSSAFLLGFNSLNSYSSVIILVTGTIFAMWLGEKITDKGIGNGISLFMVGILLISSSIYTRVY
jgi:preprotein translocase subunit SecY